MKWWYENEEEEMKLYKNEDLCIECKNEFFSKPYDHRDPTPGQLGYCIKCDNCLIKEKKMEFDKSRCFTSLNADELRAGDKVITARCMADLKTWVEADAEPNVIELIQDETNTNRFTCKCFGSNKTYDSPLAYLVERKENCTMCRKNHQLYGGCEHMEAFCKDRELLKCFVCDEFVRAEPKTEQKAEEKNCYNCRLTYTRDGVMRCMMNDRRCNNPEVACNHYESTTFEKHYRPFRDTDELIKVWEQKWSDKTNGQKWHDCKLNMPLI